MNLFTSAVFCAVFIYSYGDEAANEALHKFFNDLDGEAATIRDGCVKTTSVEIADMKDYDNPHDFPEKDLCFFKCFHEGTGFLNEDGKFQVDRVDLFLALTKQKNIEVDKLTECVKDIDNIVECTDLVKLEKCFNP